MNMRELLAYSEAQKTERAAKWNAERLAHGYCRGMQKDFCRAIPNCIRSPRMVM